MSSELLVALFSFAGTVIGALLGCIASAKLTQYRLAQLEKKVEAHNKVVERTCTLEGQMQEVQHEIRDLKGIR